MEDRLVSLIQGNTPEKRAQWALRAKSEGKKVIGLLCTYVPEEIIYAAGMLPWRITGTWDSDLNNALTYRDPIMCKYCTHALESLMRGELDFLDGVVASDWDDDRRRLYDVWCYHAKPPFAAIISAPRTPSLGAQRNFAKGISKLVSALEDFGGRKITPEALRQAIETYNKMRTLLGSIYELRKQPVPPLSGAEVLGLTTAAMVMDKAYFNSELEALMGYIRSRKSEDKPGQPRILVSGDMLDNPAFLALIESEGCQVVMDDLDTGSRYFTTLVDSDSADPLMALARRYCVRPADPTAFNWPEQIQQVVEWAREYRVDGVIELAEDFSQGRQWRAPFFTKGLTEAGIPNVHLHRDYPLGAEGALRTRVRAFLEMVSPELHS